MRTRGIVGQLPVCVCVRACMRVCARACVCGVCGTVCVCACMCIFVNDVCGVCLHKDVRTCMYVCIPVRMTPIYMFSSSYSQMSMSVVRSATANRHASTHLGAFAVLVGGVTS